MVEGHGVGQGVEGHVEDWAAAVVRVALGETCQLDLAGVDHPLVYH